MEILKSFEYKGKNYEIRLIGDGPHYSIRTYYNDKPATAFSYHLDYYEKSDTELSQNSDNINILVDLAMKDITEGIWANLVLKLKPLQ